MQPRRRPARTTVLAGGLAAVGVAAALAAVGMAVADRAALPSLADAGLQRAATLGLIVVGALIAWRRPRNPCGWLLLSGGVLVALATLADQYARLALVAHHGTLPGATWALWFTTWWWGPIYPAGIVPLVALLIPDGRLPSRRWRPIAIATTVDAGLLSVIWMLGSGPMQSSVGVSDFTGPPNPVGVLGANDFLNVLVNVLWMGGVALLLVSMASVVVRLRRSRGAERQQVKWIAYAVIGTIVVGAPVNLLSPGVFPNWTTDAVNTAGLGVAMPVAIAFAIFRYRLYDIDVVVSRALVYGALAALITAVYVGIAVGLGSLVGGGGKPNLGLSILATAVVAVGFQPVRERLQKLANRLVYGRRATPYEVLSSFGQRVSESYASDEVLPRMAQVLHEGTGAEAATVWLRSGDRLRPMATAPDGVVGYEPLPMRDGELPDFPGATRAIPVRHQGALLGALSVVSRRGEALTAIEEKLVADLAAQAGLVLKNVGLTADLQRRVEDLRASRQRLVAAQDGERRRIERNLHDGAQQHLVALAVKLGVVHLQAARDPDKARASVVALKGDVDDALETLRDLARGIYPPLLAEQGLGSALAAHARKATIPVEVDAEDVGRHPQDLEAALYFCTLEALQNVQKYAGATRACVRLRAAGGTLSVSVRDDGAGFDVETARRGAGLTNMEDRLEALGGRLRVESAPGRGTTVTATVPLATSAVERRAEAAVGALVVEEGIGALGGPGLDHQADDDDVVAGTAGVLHPAVEPGDGALDERGAGARAAGREGQLGAGGAAG